MDREQQSRLRRNASNTQNSTHPQQTSQPASPLDHRPQGHQSNLASSYTGAPQVGTSNNYGLPNQQSGNLSHGHQLQGHNNVANPFSGAPQSPQVGTSNNFDSLNPPPGTLPHGHQLQSQSNVTGQQAYAGAPQIGALNNRGLPNPPYAHQQGHSNNAVEPYAARSPVGVEGGSINQTSQQHINTGNRNIDRTGQHLPAHAPALQRSRSSQRGQPGQEWHDAQQYNPGATANTSQVQPFATGSMPSSSTHPTNDTGVPRCRLPDCRQPRYFYSRIQQQLDYCEAHLTTAIDLSFAAACRKCGRLPALENSYYCSQFCSNAERADRERVRRQPSVPSGFAPACQECRRPITESMEIYDGRFCSRQCWNAHRSSRH